MSSVRLSDEFMSDVLVHAKASSRSIPKQIEHWAQIGKVMEDNPDLSYEFVKGLLLAEAEMASGKATKYVRRKDRH